jgi:hypothetical protein
MLKRIISLFKWKVNVPLREKPCEFCDENYDEHYDEHYIKHFELYHAKRIKLKKVDSGFVCESEISKEKDTKKKK